MDRTIQLEELDSLHSIFSKDEIEVLKKDINEDLEILFWVCPSIRKNYSVKYKSFECEECYLEVDYLPPFCLHLTLPESYPSKSPPSFILSCQWLRMTDISKLCLELDQIWNQYENMEIIYNWVEFLKNDSFIFLGYEKELDLTIFCFNFFKRNEISEIIKSCSKEIFLKQGTSNFEEKEQPPKNSVMNSSHYSMVSVNDKRQFSNQSLPYKSNIYYNMQVGSKPNNADENWNGDVYDRKAKLDLNDKMSPIEVIIKFCKERDKTEFEGSHIICNICFTNQSGKNCTRFEDCRHSFCKLCIQSYFNVQINSGIFPIKCPKNNCTSEASLVQVRSIVSPALFDRYDSLLLRSALDSMDNIIYCPRILCQYPAQRDKVKDLAICPYCEYAFCVFCKLVYHGVEPCNFKTEEKNKIIEEYMNASEEMKLQMELRYGSQLIKNLVNNKITEDWIKNNCKKCPHCDVSIEKNEGCNKMVCWKCKIYLCWLCSAELDHENPYLHFSDPNSRCSQKLFHLTLDVDGNNIEFEEWDDWELL